MGKRSSASWVVIAAFTMLMPLGNSSRSRPSNLTCLKATPLILVTETGGSVPRNAASFAASSGP